MEIIRKFGGLLTFKGIGDRFASWVAKHSRPQLLEFDERTIKDIFQKQKSAVILFNKDNSEDLKKRFSEASGASEADVVFVELTPENEHYERFAEFIKLDVNSARLVALKSSEQKKSIFAGDLAGSTVDSIKEFAANLDSGKLTLIGMQEGDTDSASA